MHKQVMQFMTAMRASHPNFFTGQSVIEVGSLNINGSARQFFTGGRYIGYDLTPGDGVDVVSHFADAAPTGAADVVVSTEALEHDSRWQETLKAIQAAVRRGGLCIVTCATYGRPEHGTLRNGPQDSPATLGHYRNLGVQELVEAGFLFGWSEFRLSVDNKCHDMYFWGIRESRNRKARPRMTRRQRRNRRGPKT
jgi:hypothetical protein